MSRRRFSFSSGTTKLFQVTFRNILNNNIYKEGRFIDLYPFYTNPDKYPNEFMERGYLNLSEVPESTTYGDLLVGFFSQLTEGTYIQITDFLQDQIASSKVVNLLNYIDDYNKSLNANDFSSHIIIVTEESYGYIYYNTNTRATNLIKLEKAYTDIYFE